MTSYTILKNSSLIVYPYGDYPQQGWTVNNNIASHSGCNSGYIRTDFDLSSAQQWTFEYTILSLDTGIVRIEVDGVQGVNRNTAGTYSETFTTSNPIGLVRFFATGISSLQLLKVYPIGEFTEGLTFAFNEDADKWVTYYDYVPEFMVKFITSFFTFKNGTMWEHNVNPLRNNFYGTQYNTRLRIVFNAEYENSKVLFNIRLDSKGAWYVPNIETEKNDKFPNGMKSRIKLQNMKLIDGKKWADFLRDMNDPQFGNIPDPVQRQLTSLFKGRVLQGCYAYIDLQCDDTTEAKLNSLEIWFSEDERSI